MRKTPNKRAVWMPKNDPRGVAPRLETDDLGSQKSQNALKTGGEVREKKMQKRKNKKYILKMYRPRGSVKLIKARAKPFALRLRLGRSGLNAARPAILLTAKSH